MYDLYFINGGFGPYLTFVNPGTGAIIACYRPTGEESWPYLRGNISTFEGSKFICKVQTIEEGKNLYPEYFI